MGKIILGQMHERQDRDWETLYQRHDEELEALLQHQTEERLALSVRHTAEHEEVLLSQAVWDDDEVDPGTRP